MDRSASTTPMPAREASPLAPRPRSLADTGLSLNFLAELVAKHLYLGGVLDIGQLSTRTALAGSIVEQVLNHLRKEARIEVRGVEARGASLRYALTDRGRAGALESLMKSGYVGPAPVSLEDYTRVVWAQSVHRAVVTRDAMRAAFADLVVPGGLLDQLGPAMHSGRAIFIYGPPGTGKTYLSRRLARLLGGIVLIPHAIAIREAVVQVFDPVLHRPLPQDSSTPNFALGEGHDPRFVPCERPVVVTGGELTLQMLEVHYDAAHRLYRTPLQLKANNGIYIVDDLGRQRVAPIQLLNRWIIPLEEQRDYVTLGSGEGFPVPFDMVLVFSTNLNPLQLADEAFLRRLGYKIRFDYLDREDYEAIWRKVCAEQGIAFDAGVLRHLFDNYYARSQTPLVACHPRDLIGLAADHCRYEGRPVEVTPASIDFAWKNYFIHLA